MGTDSHKPTKGTRLAERGDSLRSTLPAGVQFPGLLHAMLTGADQQGYGDIACWQPHGLSFKIHDRKRFLDEVMPLYFKLTRFSSFQRQLNLYGFARVEHSGPDHKSYYHKHFLRHSPRSVWLMKRTTPPKTKHHQGDEGSSQASSHPQLLNFSEVQTSMAAPSAPATTFTSPVSVATLTARAAVQTGPPEPCQDKGHKTRAAFSTLLAKQHTSHSDGTVPSSQDMFRHQQPATALYILTGGEAARVAPKLVSTRFKPAGNILTVPKSSTPHLSPEGKHHTDLLLVAAYEVSSLEKPNIFHKGKRQDVAVTRGDAAVCTYPTKDETHKSHQHTSSRDQPWFFVDEWSGVRSKVADDSSDLCSCSSTVDSSLHSLT